MYGFGGRKRGVEIRICWKEKRKRDLSGVELKMERKEERKGDLSLLKGKMNGKYYFEGKKLGMES
jgi:hypothetical protein